MSTGRHLVMSIVAGLLLAPLAHAADGEIVACFAKKKGTLRISSTRSCKKHESLLSWNSQGPPGSSGLPGVSPLSSLERVEFSSKNNSDPRKNAFAKCPAGKKVIAGGGEILTAGNSIGSVALKSSFPSKDLDGWAATAEEVVSITTNWFVTAHALCAVVSQ